MRLLLHTLCVGLALTMVQTVHGQDVSFAVRAGSLGPGLELATSLVPRLNVRVAGHYFGYSRSDEFEDEITVRADADVKLASGAAFADFYPFRKIFRLTAGLVYNRNRANVSVTPLDSYTFDEKEFSPEKIGTLTATIRHKASINPYAGIGFGNALRGTRVGLLLDLGVLYTDSPRLDATGTGMIAPTARQAPSIEEDLSGIKLYPLVSLGLSIRL